MVQQYLEELLEQDIKFLVFCHHKVMNDGIAQVLNKCGPAHSPVCGILLTALIGPASFSPLSDDGSAASSHSPPHFQCNTADADFDSLQGRGASCVMNCLRLPHAGKR